MNSQRIKYRRLEMGGGFSSGWLKKGKELHSDYTDYETITPITKAVKIEEICVIFL